MTRPKSLVAPRLLASAHDSLFMAPCAGGCAMLQWAEARTSLVVRRWLIAYIQAHPLTPPSLSRMSLRIMVCCADPSLYTSISRLVYTSSHILGAKGFDSGHPRGL